MKKVTIMLATYNGEKYLEEQLESIIKQTYENWQLIISDDNSQDSTKQIINKYILLYPNQIKCIDNKNEHSAKGNFINLFNNVEESDYYMFCDQDDVWINTKIEKFVTRIEKENDVEPILMYCDLKIVDKKLNLLQDSFLKYTNNYLPNDEFINFTLENHIPGCVMFFNYSLKEAIGKIPNKCRMHDWWTALVAATYGKIIFIDESLNLYRQHENNTIGVKKQNNMKSLTKIKNMKDFNKSVLTQLKSFEEKYEISDIEIKKILINSIKILKSKNIVSKLLILKFNKYRFADRKKFYKYLLINAN